MAKTMAQAARESARELEGTAAECTAHHAGFILGARWYRENGATRIPAARLTSVIDLVRAEWDAAGRHESLTAAIVRAIVAMQGGGSRG